MLKLQVLNHIWLLIPIFVWNIIFAKRLPQEGFHSDIGVPQAILIAAHMLRMVIFIWPLFLPLQWNDMLSQFGIIIYIAGLLFYLFTWVPLLYYPDTIWSKSAAGLLAPAVTPMFWLIGITIIGKSWPYGLVSLRYKAVY